MAQRADDQRHDSPADAGAQLMSGTSTTAGGRATEAGMSFQASVAAWFAAHLVANMPVGDKFGMAGHTQHMQLVDRVGFDHLRRRWRLRKLVEQIHGHGRAWSG